MNPAKVIRTNMVSVTEAYLLPSEVCVGVSEGTTSSDFISTVPPK